MSLLYVSRDMVLWNYKYLYIHNDKEQFEIQADTLINFERVQVKFTLQELLLYNLQVFMKVSWTGNCKITVVYELTLVQIATVVYDYGFGPLDPSNMYDMICHRDQ